MQPLSRMADLCSPGSIVARIEHSIVFPPVLAYHLLRLLQFTQAFLYSSEFLASGFIATRSTRLDPV